MARLQIIRYYNKVIEQVFGKLYSFEPTPDKKIIVKKIPIKYGNYVRYDSTQETHEQRGMRTDLQLPIISYSLTGLGLDESRMKNNSSQFTSICNGTAEEVFSPVPYTLNYSIYIRTKTRNEMYDILEQVLPYFTPTINFTMNLVKLHNVVFSDTCKLSMSDVSERIDNFDDAESKRKVEWQIDAMLYGWLMKSNHIIDENMVSSDGQPLQTNDLKYVINDVNVVFENFSSGLELLDFSNVYDVQDNFLYD